MNIIFPIIFTILAVLFFYLLEKNTGFGKIKNIYKQLIIGAVFGLVAISGSELGWEISGATMNVRDSAPLSAGLIFGWQAGLIAGFIGGLYRALSVFWGAGTYTALACSLSTALAGVVAALLRKFMFDDKKPTWGYAAGITVVMEIFHMLMIFITNMNDPNTAFVFVRACTLPMATLNALTVVIAVITVTLLSREKIKREKGKEQIAQTFQRWLVLCILVAFAVTSVFTFYLQTGMRDRQIADTFETTIRDVVEDIRGKSDFTLEQTAKQVKAAYLENPTRPLTAISEDLDVWEINIVDRFGMITNSTDPDLIGSFDMDSTEQSRVFMTLVNAAQETTLVQSYGPIGMDGVTLRKYAGISLADGGFLQIGYDADQFHDRLDQFVVDFTKNRHVGANGFVAVCDENLKLVTETKRDEWPIDAIGIVPNEEMLAKKPATQIYETDIVNKETNFREEYLYVFSFAEEYCIIAAMPKDDAMLIRDASAYLSIFMQVMIFGVLFVVLYFLIKHIIIDNIHKINGTLSKISCGDLNELVDVRSNVEFASLSDDINTTVAALKRYIKEAAARIDRELEYAKQIQLSALPTAFPSHDSVNIHAQMIAAKEVGGDFFDYYQLDEHNVAFLVADVSGKGIPAAMFMMTAKTIIKDLAERGLPVDEIFTKANEKLCENNESGMFVTAWMGILNTQTGILTYANAGHNPPLIGKNGNFEYLRSRAGLVLAGMDGIRYRIHEIALEAGDRIFLYTDGVSEATNAENALYGEGRLLSFARGNGYLTQEEFLRDLKADVDAFVGDAPQFDDITMLVFDFKKKEE